MSKLPFAAVLVLLASTWSFAAPGLAQGIDPALSSHALLLASDAEAGTTSHRLPRPSSNSSNGPASIPSAESEDEDSAAPAVNQDELKAKIERLKREGAADGQSSPGSAPLQTSKSRILQGSIDQYGDAKQQAFNINLGIVAKKDQDAKLPSKIIQLLPNSPAQQAGLRVGDAVVNETLDKDVVHLTLSRAGKTFQVAIKSNSNAMLDLTSDQATLKVSTARNALQAGATRSSLQGGTTGVRLNGVVEQMREHDVVMILDMSGSMRTRDCQGLSRWEWVGRQSNELALAAQQASSDLTVMLFSSGYQVMEHANPSLIPMIFQHVQPGGGTILGAPLNDALTRYFSARQANPSTKPLIIAIITDGLPNDYGSVRQEIIDAANATRRDGEISITFLLINGWLSGNRQMEQLDSQLPTQRDIVNLVEFDQVLRLGLKESLSEALSGKQLRNVPLSPNNMQNSFGLGFNNWMGGGRPGRGFGGNGLIPTPLSPFFPNGAGGIRNYP